MTSVLKWVAFKDAREAAKDGWVATHVNIHDKTYLMEKKI